MGLFSWNCRGCGHPALMAGATNAINDWMRKVVALMPSGSILMGEYNGYGRVGESESLAFDRPELWHQACWRGAGKPMTYTQESRSADDQGYFFDDPAHDLAEPAATPETGGRRT